MPEPEQLSPLDIRKHRAFSVVFIKASTVAKVRRWLDRLAVPPSEQSDLAQDVLTAAWKTWCYYDPWRSEPLRWLNRIAVRVAAAHHKRMRRLDFGALTDVVDVEDPSPCSYECVETIEWLGSAHPDGVRVVAAADCLGIPVNVAAGSVGFTPSVAYSRRAKLLATLRSATATRRLRPASKEAAYAVDRRV